MHYSNQSSDSNMDVIFRKTSLHRYFSFFIPMSKLPGKKNDPKNHKNVRMLQN